MESLHGKSIKTRTENYYLIKSISILQYIPMYWLETK